MIRGGQGRSSESILGDATVLAATFTIAAVLLIILALVL